MLLALRNQSGTAIVQDQTPTAAAIAASQTGSRHAHRASDAQSRQARRRPPSATAVRISRATTAPTRVIAAATLPPTVTPSLVGELFLRFDGNQINMINLGERELDLTVLDFVQRLPEAVLQLQQQPLDKRAGCGATTG